MALDAVSNASSGAGAPSDSSWFSSYPGLVNWTAPITAMGHSLGSNTALISGGMALRPCAPMNLTLGPDYLTLFGDQGQCNRSLAQGGLDSQLGPYELRDPRISAVIALDPGPSYWFPSGSTYQSWFSDRSFSQGFQVPLLLSSMTESFGNVDAAYDSFPQINGTTMKMLVLQLNGSHNTYANDCELRVLLNISGPASPGCGQNDVLKLADYHSVRTALHSTA